MKCHCPILNPAGRFAIIINYIIFYKPENGYNNIMITKPSDRSSGFVLIIERYLLIFRYFISGDNLMKRLDLYSRKTGHWNGYNSTVDPTISNNFATAAFRFAHTLIPVNHRHFYNQCVCITYYQGSGLKAFAYFYGLA